MQSYLVTPASESESQLLAALFKKMRVKAALLPNSEGQPQAPKTSQSATKSVAARKPVVPRNQQEANILEAVGELKEILAGRKQAMSLEEFWAEVSAEVEATADAG